MKHMIFGAFAALLLPVACAQSVEPVAPTSPVVEPAPTPPTPAVEEIIAPIRTPAPVHTHTPQPAAEEFTPASALHCRGVYTEGGLLLCHGQAGERIRFVGSRTRTITADERGLVTFGLKREEPETVTVTGLNSGETLSFDIADREDDFRRIEGMDCDKIDARTQEQRDHAGRSWVTKQNAFASFNAGNGPAAGFVQPTEGRISSPFGPTRQYIGISAVTGEPCEKTRVHRGYDIAAPTGTEILAPADGVITLADDDLYYEGGTIFLDHGLGVVSIFMHISALHVEPGDTVTAGQLIGEVGSTGNSTGPHLHWAIKWRDTDAESRDNDFYIDPELLLDWPSAE